MNSLIKIYCDGACSGNPGPGACAAVVFEDGKKEKVFTHAASKTTNNRMEILGAILGLEKIPKNSTVLVVTDSKYLKDAITSWIKKWKTNGWLTGAKTPVKNQSLWIRLEAAVARHEKVDWEWVKGHSGVHGNEWADLAANRALNVLLAENRARVGYCNR